MDRSCDQVTLYGTLSSADAYRIRDFLQRSTVQFEWVELSSDMEARREALVDGIDDPRLPVCVFPDGSRLEAPTLQQVAAKLGWIAPPRYAEYDLSIYGAGPAGLSAAVYAASEGLRTVVIEREAVGGQAGTSSRIENYLGFPRGISGAELAERARQQAVAFGAEILKVREGVGAEFYPGRMVGHLADGGRIVSRANICATGAQYRRLALPGEEQLCGAGLFYGAGASEAALCRGEDVYIVGGGNSAGQAVMHFAAYARSVTLLVRGAQLADSVSQYLIDRIAATPNVTVRTRCQITELHGDGRLEAITITAADGTSEIVRTGRLFVCIGAVPNTQGWGERIGIALDERGFVLTGADLMPDGRRPEGWTLDRDPLFLETNIPGNFAAGDVRHGSIKRVAAAVGEGAMAVRLVHDYLARL